MKCVDCGKECGTGDMPETYNGCCMECFKKRQEIIKKMLGQQPIWQHVSEPKIYEQGWVCPKCGAVMSPRQACCPFCSGNKTVTVGLTATWDKSDSLDPYC